MTLARDSSSYLPVASRTSLNWTVYYPTAWNCFPMAALRRYTVCWTMGTLEVPSAYFCSTYLARNANGTKLSWKRYSNTITKILPEWSLQNYVRNSRTRERHPSPRRQHHVNTLSGKEVVAPPVWPNMGKKIRWRPKQQFTVKGRAATSAHAVRVLCRRLLPLGKKSWKWRTSSKISNETLIFEAVFLDVICAGETVNLPLDGGLLNHPRKRLAWSDQENYYWPRLVTLHTHRPRYTNPPLLLLGVLETNCVWGCPIAYLFKWAGILKAALHTAHTNFLIDCEQHAQFLCNWILHKEVAHKNK